MSADSSSINATTSAVSLFEKSLCLLQESFERDANAQCQFGLGLEVVKCLVVVVGNER